MNNKFLIFFVLMIVLSITSIVLKANELINLSWFVALIPMLITFVSALVFFIKDVIKQN